MFEGECDKLLCMEEVLYNCVVGQEEVIKVVFDVVCCLCVGLFDLNCLVGLFLFFGLIGVGKIELCKLLVEFLFDSVDVMICIDMSEFMEKYSVVCLIGVFLGYVGYEEGGYLIEVVCCCLYLLILLDEVEKVYLDVFNILLQVLDDGCLIDGQGCIVDFCNIVIVMILNLGLYQIQDMSVDDSLEVYMQMKVVVMGVVQVYFCLEFINCLDDIVVFYLLDKQQIKQIVCIQMCGLEKCLVECGLKLVVFDVVFDLFGNVGFDLVYGV